jgi:uncharacterized membrane protein YsdA (DUF1294 family)
MPYVLAFFGGYFGASFGRMSQYDQTQSLLISIGVVLVTAFLHGLIYFFHTRKNR